MLTVLVFIMGIMVVVLLAGVVAIIVTATLLCLDDIYLWGREYYHYRIKPGGPVIQPEYNTYKSRV